MTQPVGTDPATAAGNAPFLTRFRVPLQFTAATLFWGGSWIGIKYQVESVPPAWAVTYRFLIAGFALLAWCRLRGVPLRMPRHAWPFLFLVGLFQFVLNFNFVYEAEVHVPSAIPAVAFAVLMVPNAILARIFLGQRVSRRFLGGAALGIGGIFLLFADQIGSSSAPRETILGIILVIGAVLATSIVNIMQATARATSFPPLSGLAWAMLIGAFIDGAYSWAVSGPPPAGEGARFWVSLLYLGFLAGALSYAAYFDMIRSIGPASAAWVNVVIPILAVAISIAVENFHATLQGIGGSLLAILGLVLALARPATGRRKRSAGAAHPLPAPAVLPPVSPPPVSSPAVPPPAAPSAGSRNEP